MILRNTVLVGLNLLKSKASLDPHNKHKGLVSTLSLLQNDYKIDPLALALVRFFYIYIVSRLLLSSLALCLPLSKV